MKTALLLAVLSIFNPLVARAENSKKYPMAGLWQASTIIGGVFIHHVIDLRLPLGREEIHLSNSTNHANATVFFAWTFSRGILTRFATGGESATSTVRFVSRKQIILTHSGGFPQIKDATFVYDLIEHEDEGGCRLHNKPDDSLGKTHLSRDAYAIVENDSRSRMRTSL